jgi:CRP-like cAMP-binding protein
MDDLRSRRLSREIFLAAAGAGAGFGDLEPWALDRLSGMIEEEEPAPGSLVYDTGQLPDHFYFLRRGRVELAREGRPTQVVEGPRALGMLDALLERPRRHSCRARGPAELAKVPMDAWLGLLEDSFPLARASVANLVDSVALLEGRRHAAEVPAVRAPLRLASSGAALDLVDRLALLMSVPPLRGCSVQSIGDLALASDEARFAAGAPLWTPGGSPESVVVVIEGIVEATRDRDAAIWRGGAGQVVCGIGGFGPLRATWQARAATNVRTLSFELEDWFDVMEENFDMVRTTLANLALERERLADAA